MTFTAAEAYDAEYKYTMLRRFGSQEEADRRLSDPRTREMIEWAQRHPRSNPLTPRPKKR